MSHLEDYSSVEQPILPLQLLGITDGLKREVQPEQGDRAALLQETLERFRKNVERIDPLN